ncbi:ABC transporter ATP-binding protein [Paenibacillus sp. JSM ZJ436]|uniref:ABC transporter ATP-binding protein n=1 Tax=Paenibacillus sp. JSM ZJ436 TaxID=3376190 RepID=UPI00379AFDBB
MTSKRQEHSNREQPDTQAPALEVKGIHKTFHSRRQRVQVLEGISLTVQPGQFVSMIGPSGSGKSTLFHVIGGLIHPDQGSIMMHDEEVTGSKGRVAYMPQQPALFPWRTTLDNIILPRELAGMSREQARAEAARLMEHAGLHGFEQAFPETLSGGMQQRAAFLRALMSPQELMCLDEPFSALDALTRSDMQRWLLDLWEEHRRSVLMITHHIEEALLLSDVIYVLSRRPAQILKTIHVPFPRPRSEELLLDPDFLSLKQELAETMRHEIHR